MIDLALSLLLTTAQPQIQAQRQNRAIDLAVFLAGGSLAVAYCWKWVMDDSQNEPPKLTIVPPPEYPIESTEPTPKPPVEPQEIDQQGGVEEISFPDIDWDAEPPQKPAQPPVSLAALAAKLGVKERETPGEVELEKITQLPLEQRKDWFVEYLAVNDLAYLLKLLKATPIVVYGLERSGKNTLACTIAALRRVFFPQPIVAASPHANRDNPFPESFLTVGYDANGTNYGAIAAQLKALYDWVRVGDTSSITCLWDESSSYKAGFQAGDLPLLDSFLLFCMTQTAKHNKYQIILASGMTNACLPGSDGTSTFRGEGIVSISRRADTDMFGEKSPSPHITIEGLGMPKPETFLFPEWLNAHWVFDIFPECNKPIELPVHLVQRGSNVIPFRTREPETVQALNLTQGNNSGVSEPGRSEVEPNSEPGLNVQKTDAELLEQIAELRQAGLNQDQIILAIWRAKKGGSKAYIAAREKYRQLTGGSEAS